MKRPAPPPRRSPRSVVRRLLLSAALLVPSLVLGSAPPSGAMQPEPPPPSVPATTRAAAGCASSDFTEAVLCWGDAAARGKRSIVVTVSAAQSLRADAGLDAVADAVPKLRDKLIVIVPDGVRTGSGGTLLLALAAHRIVGVHSSISPLTESGHRRLNELAGCPPDGFCDTVRTRARSGADLVERRLAQDARTSLFTAGPEQEAAPPDPVDGGGSGDEGSRGAPPTDLADDPSGDARTVLFVVGAVLVCLVATLGLMVRRTGAPAETPPRATTAGTASSATTASTASAPDARRQPVTVPETPTAPQPTAPRATAPQPAAPQPTAPRTPPPPGPTTPHRSATVRTVLRPQGYVDIDGLLFRAGWGGPGEPPPPGSPVYVVRNSTGELTVHDHRTVDDDPHA